MKFLDEVRVINDNYVSEGVKKGDVVCFFNSDVLKNAYYLDLSKVIDRSTNSLIPTQLGKFSAEDNYAMLEASDSETK